MPGSRWLIIQFGARAERGRTFLQHPYDVILFITECQTNYFTSRTDFTIHTRVAIYVRNIRRNEITRRRRRRHTATWIVIATCGSTVVLMSNTRLIIRLVGHYFVLVEKTRYPSRRRRKCVRVNENIKSDYGDRMINARLTPERQRSLAEDRYYEHGDWWRKVISENGISDAKEPAWFWSVLIGL